MRRFRSCGAALATMVVLLVSGWQIWAGSASQSVTEILQGQVDWTRGEISARGIGVRPQGISDPKARVMAREAAIVVAERNLVKIVHGIQVVSDSTVRDLTLESDEIRQRVEGFIKGARIVSERELRDGSYEVVVGLPMYGREQSLAQSIDLGGMIAGRLKPPEEAPVVETPPVEPAPAEPVRVEPPTTQPAEPEPTPAPAGVPLQPYTGLLVDCRGLPLAPSMSPKILDETGQEVWGTVKADPDFVNEVGIASYFKTMEQAREGRVGRNPLVVKALRTSGARFFHANAVVSQADAARIVAENARPGFLERLAVGFLVD